MYTASDRNAPDIRKVAQVELARIFGDIPDGQDDLWRVKPVTSREFFETFIGEPLFPKQQELCDALLGDDPLVWDETFFEGDCFWGKGSGKDLTVAKIMTYIVYRLLCLHDPQAFLGIGKGDQIDLVNVCVNAKLAKDVFFKKLKVTVRNAINPKTGKNWFEERGTNLKEGKGIQSTEIRFPFGITCHSLNSESYSGEGMSILFGVMDEVGSFPIVEGMKLYKAIRSSIKSRFPKLGKFVLLSYKYHANDLMVIQYRAGKKDPKTFTSKGATWEIRLNISREDLADEYVRDPENARRVYECEGEFSEEGYIRRKEAITKIVGKGYENPIVGGHTTVRSIGSLVFHDWFRGIENKVYVAHVDLALGKTTKRGDAAGFMLAHPAAMFQTLDQGAVDELHRLGMDASAHMDSEPEAPSKGIEIDLALQIIAPSGGEIIFGDIRSLIYTLKEQLGFNIAFVSYDGFESKDSVQQIQSHGIACERISVDTSIVPYDTLKSLLYQGLFKGYHHPTLIRELWELLERNGKVDHPEYSYRRQEEEGINRGSKDVADCAAAIASKIVPDIPLQPGIYFGSM